MLKFTIEELSPEEYEEMYEEYEEMYEEDEDEYEEYEEDEMKPIYCPDCGRLLGEVEADGTEKKGFYCWTCQGMLRNY